MSVGGGGCTNNGQCGSCAICDNGTCKYLCNEGQTCINNQCVTANNTSNSIYITIPNSTCAGVPFNITINAVVSSSAYTGTIGIEVLNQYSNQYIISTTDQMSLGIANYDLTIKCPGTYGIWANVVGSNIWGGNVITVNNCTGGCISSCMNCGNNSTPVTFNKYMPLLIGVTTGLGIVGLYYVVTRK